MAQEPNPTLVSFASAHTSQLSWQGATRVYPSKNFYWKSISCVSLLNSALEQRGEMGGNIWVAIAEREHKLEQARKQIWSVVIVYKIIDV